jgi:hypothetical protein
MPRHLAATKGAAGERGQRRLPSVQGRMQRAKAGPELLVQEAVSTSFDLDIAILPPGHVTEANFSPALQASSHFLSASQDC